MLMRRIRLMILSLTISIFGNAQWTTDVLQNTLVSNVNTGDSKSISCSDGKIWIAYYKSVPAPNYFEMRAQLLDANGVQLLGPEGVLVNNIPHSSFTSVFSAIIDGNNNLIVALAATTSPNTIYVSKLSQAGTVVWSTPFSAPNGLNPKLGALNNGDIIVSWLPTAGTLANRAHMQKLNAATGAAQWASPILVVPITPAQRTTPGHIHPLSNNEFLHVFHSRSVAFGTASSLWAQRYDASGNPIWTVPVQLTNRTTAFNRDYSPIMHNDTLFIGYMGASGSRLDVFVQRVNPDGTTPWGINGSDFALDINLYEQDIMIAVSPTQNCVWAAGRVSNTSQGSLGTYVQKFDKSTGARLFTDLGKAIYNIAPAGYVTPHSIAKFSDDLPVLLLMKTNSATSNFLYAAKLDNNGNFAWTGDTVALARYPSSKLRMLITQEINNQVVATWVENKGTMPLPYAQPIRTDGTTGLIAPIAGFTSNKQSICRDSAIRFTSTSSGFITNYSWSFPGGSPATSTDINPVVSYHANGTYNVTLTVSSSGGSNTITQTNHVTVNGVSANAGPDFTIVDGDQVTLLGEANFGTPATITWTPANALSNANSLNPVAKPNATTVYSLAIKDANGCSSTDNTTVTVVPYCIKVTDAFTPNNDGINDRWLVTNGVTCYSNLKVVVYNRYGSAVYSNNNYNNDWDGTYKGKPVTDGTYFYYVTFRTITGKTMALRGDVTILR